MEIMQIINLGLTIIGGATVLLNTFAHLTKNKTDDKILAFLKKVLAIISVNVDDKTLNINSQKTLIEVKVK